jgi:hypothetical protein
VTAEKRIAVAWLFSRKKEQIWEETDENFKPGEKQK